MFLQSHTFCHSTTFPKAPFSSSLSSCLFRKLKSRSAIRSCSIRQESSREFERKRKVVEHICLLKVKDDLQDDKANVMLDYLYTFQYQMGGIVAVSLGRISDPNSENYSHAFFTRFQKKEDLEKFYENAFYLGVLKDYVMPYCHGLINVDYEAEVEDDILPIFRKGEDFNFGVEFIILIGFIESAMGKPVENAMGSFTKLTKQFPSLIVQATQGSNCNPTSKDYTHAVMMRFRSPKKIHLTVQAFQIFMGSSEYKDIWNTKFQAITRHILQVHFSVDPVGTELM